jgi:hypothetical protein
MRTAETATLKLEKKENKELQKLLGSSYLKVNRI